MYWVISWLPKILHNSNLIQMLSIIFTLWLGKRNKNVLPPEGKKGEGAGREGGNEEETQKERKEGPYQAPDSIRFLDISNSDWVWWLQMEWIPSWGSLWMAFPSSSAPLFIPAFPFDRRNSGLILLRWLGSPNLKRLPCLSNKYGLYSSYFPFVWYLG